MPEKFAIEELVELRRLVSNSDSIELKLTVPERARRATNSALGIDPLDAQIRQVFFFDTPDLDLNAAGVVARARRIQGKPHDSVVKLRPVMPETVPAKMRRDPGFTIEVDALPGGYVCSASMKAELGNELIHEAVRGERPLRKLFTKPQRQFFETHAPSGITLDDLSVLGPIFVLKVRVTPSELGRRLVGELWLYPNGDRVVELSTKCLPGEGFDTAIAVRDFLSAKGLDLSGEQQTKTKTALEFFSRELRGVAAAT